MFKTYISPSLLDAFTNNYDWISMIKREEREISVAMQNGIDWEKAVIEGEFEELNEIINGGLYQQMVYGSLDKFFLFGYADIVKYDTVIDLKFKANYDFPSYYNSNQRLVYPYLLGLDNFSYIIGTGTDVHNPTSICREDYTRDDNLLRERLFDFDRAIDHFGLREIYEQNYSMDRIIERIEDDKSILNTKGEKLCVLH